MKEFKQVRRGLLKFAVLSTINSTRFGFCTQEIQEKLARTEFTMPDGTLYPLLSQIRREKLVTSGREERDNMSIRKHYHMTKKGKDLLRELNLYWKIINVNIRELGSPPIKLLY